MTTVTDELVNKGIEWDKFYPVCSGLVSGLVSQCEFGAVESCWLDTIICFSLSYKNNIRTTHEQHKNMTMLLNRHYQCNSLNYKHTSNVHCSPLVDLVYNNHWQPQ